MNGPGDPRMETAAGPSRPANEPLPPARPALRSVRVLIVDDAAPVARSTSRLLEFFGHVTAVAATGAEALAMLARTPRWDLVLLDLGLPDMDGREVLRRIDVERPDVAVIVFSGAGRDEIERTLPGARFVAKPYQIEHLLAAVEDATARRRPARDATSSTCRPAL